MEMKAIDQLPGQLRAAAAAAKGASVQPAAAPAAKADFSEVLEASLDRVNATQEQAANVARDFELGASGASLPEVMLSLQKANSAFQHAVQVRTQARLRLPRHHEHAGAA